MNAKTLTLALSALALLSSSAANAQATQYGYGMGSPTVLSYPAMVGTGAIAGYDVPLFGKHTWFDNRIAGYGYGQNLSYGGLGYGACGVNTLSAVVPNTCGSALIPVSGQRRANALADVRLFGFGFGFGTVTPRFDMRPAGWSY